MADKPVQRRLAAILAADVAGYSRMMQTDEVGTLAMLKERRRDILGPLVAQHQGRVFKIAGDGVLVEFASAVNALRCAVDLQKDMTAANRGTPDDRHVVLRIGINLGDVMVEGGDLYGDGVNVAARLEALAEPGGVLVSATTYDHLKSKVEVGFEDIGVQTLKNITEPVRVYRVSQPELIAPTRQTSEPKRPSPLTDKPSIAVLPFQNMSGDPSQQYLSDGITEDILTELSRFKDLSVAARYASFHLGNKGQNPIQTARELGVNYVVEGSVRIVGDRIRITVQLINAKTDSHIWAERYDRENRDIFAVQDEVVAAIVATLEGRMVAAAAEQSRKKPTSSWTAYEFLLQGRVLANAHTEKEAVPLLRRAIEIDPTFAQAHAWLAFGLLGIYWFDANAATLKEASVAAQRALELDSNDPTVHQANAMVMLWARQYERSDTHFDRAIALNPANAEIRADRANWLRYVGRAEEALTVIDDALRRSPYAPVWFWRIRGASLFQLDRHEEAVSALENMVQKDRYAWAYLAAAHAYLGNTVAAGQALAKARELTPDTPLVALIANIPFAHSEARDHFLDGLRKAGLEE